MNKTKKKRNSKNKGNSKNKSRKRIKGGEHSVTLYTWPMRKPDPNDKNNEMLYEFVEHNTGSRLKTSKRNIDKWIDMMFNNGNLIPKDITPSKQVLEARFGEKKNDANDVSVTKK